MRIRHVKHMLQRVQIPPSLLYWTNRKQPVHTYRFYSVHYHSVAIEISSKSENIIYEIIFQKKWNRECRKFLASQRCRRHNRVSLPASQTRLLPIGPVCRHRCATMRNSVSAFSIACALFGVNTDTGTDTQQRWGIDRQHISRYGCHSSEVAGATRCDSAVGDLCRRIARWSQSLGSDQHTSASPGGVSAGNE